MTVGLAEFLTPFLLLVVVVVVVVDFGLDLPLNVLKYDIINFKVFDF